jgi:integrase
MTTKKLDDEAIRNAEARRKQYFIFDETFGGDEEAGRFGLQVSPGGLKKFVIIIIRDGVRHIEVIGNAKTMPVDHARSLARTRIRALTASEDSIGPDSPFEVIAELMMSRKIPKWRPSTGQLNDTLLRSSVLPFFTGRRISEISRSDIETWFAGLSGKQDAANRCLPLVSAILTEAGEMGVRASEETNPVLGMRRYRRSKRLRVLTADEIKRLGEALDKRRAKFPLETAMIELLFYTGIRKRELQDLLWANFHGDHLILPDIKLGSRIVYISQQARAVLEKLKKTSGRSELVFPSSGKRGLYIDAFWRKLRDEIGISDVRIADLRTTFANEAHRGGVNPKVIAALLGHRQPESTFRLIAPDEAEICDALKLVEQALSKKDDGDDQ